MAAPHSVDAAPLVPPDLSMRGALVPGVPMSGELATGGEHVFELELGADEAILVEIDQAEVDIEVILVVNDEQLLVDLPVRNLAPERVCYVASAAESVKLRVRPYGAASGGYRATLLHQRSATTQDRFCERALRAFMEGDLFLEGEAKIPRLQEAMNLARQAEDPFLEGLSLRQLGSLWLDRNRIDRAIAAFREALPAMRRAGSTLIEISLLNRLAMAELERGALEASILGLDQALMLSERAGTSWGEAITLHNRGEVERIVGASHRAIEFYQASLANSQREDMPIETANTQQRLGDVYAQLDHHREALDALRRAEAVFREAGNAPRLASALLSKGWVHVLRGEPGQAVPILRESLALFEGKGMVNSASAARDRLGTALLATGDFAAALAEYQAAYQAATDSGSQRDAANSAANIGCLLQKWGKVQEAEARLAEAREQLRAVDDAKALASVEACLARLAQDQGELDVALGHIETSIAIVDGLRAEARLRGARYRPIRFWQNDTELHTELLMARYRETNQARFAVRAFEAADLTRARNLYDLVLESQVGVGSTAPEGLLKRQRQIQQELNAVQAQRRELQQAGASDTLLTAILSKLGELSLALEQARADVRAADPRFAELAEPRTVELSELQAALPERTVLLSFALGESHSTLFVVEATRFEAYELPPRARIDAQAKALYEALRASRNGGFQHELAAEALAELLWQGVELPADTETLWVVHDGMLHYLPFGVLPSPRAGAEPGKLLGEDLEIQSVPSASALLALIQRDAARPRPPKEVAVFADAVYSPDDDRLEAPAAPAPTNAARERSVRLDRLPEGPLPRLPSTADEAKSILALLDPNRTLGALELEATKQRVLETPLNQYRILHFATHAFVEDRFPELSGLVLSRVDADGSPIDGNLYLHEIYDLELAADLVVLSGCQTALGQEVRGDGLVSLTRGFLYAGASQVLVSLWSVDDAATAHLMADFYRSMIEDGAAPAAALRTAQRRMRQIPRWSAPYYWAAFVLQGAAS